MKLIIGSVLLLTTLNFGYAQEILEKYDGNVNVSGEFKLKELSNTLNFQLLGKKKNYAIELTYQGQGAKNSCVYKVNRITAPQQTRGLNGIIFAKMLKESPCEFNLDNKEEEQLLNSLRLINIGYRLTSPTQINGKIELQSLKKNYRSNF